MCGVRVRHSGPGVHVRRSGPGVFCALGGLVRGLPGGVQWWGPFLLLLFGTARVLMLRNTVYSDYSEEAPSLFQTIIDAL